MSRKDRNALSTFQRIAAPQLLLFGWNPIYHPGNAPVFYLFLAEGWTDDPQAAVVPVLAGTPVQIVGPLGIEVREEDPATGEVITWTTDSATVVDVQGWVALEIMRPQGGFRPWVELTLNNGKNVQANGQQMQNFRSGIAENPPAFLWAPGQWPNYNASPWGDP